jgi:glycosyltransferase involved in cell wall biosynthesis
LRAARLLHRDFPQCRFVICGAPLFGDARSASYYHEVQELARGLPVEFTGWTDTVADVLANLDLLVVPSTPIDAAPLVILEAFAAGVPVMALASGGIPELIEHDVTGFLVKERSPEALASAMRRLLTMDPCRLREVSACALARTRDEFSLERYRARILESIEAARQV